MPSGAPISSIVNAESSIAEAVAEKIDASLEAWFGEFQRDLNFRNTRDPYAIMVAEFMLQQTTAVTVQGYFPVFMEQFPTVQSLASATEDEVMRLWAGLGYYRRARQLQAAARRIVEVHGGIVPSDVAALQKLPGVGRYTAGAIASAAYDLPAPILEANTLRVFSRLSGINGTVGDAAFMRQLWHVAERLVSCAKSPRVFNVAAMELGALVCRPVPQCETCPVREFCRAYESGAAAEIPRQRPRREKVDVALHGFVLSNTHGEFLVRRIPAGEWHAGMWEFPTVRLQNTRSYDDTTASLLSIQEQLDLQISQAVQLFPFRKLTYAVTHHRVRLQVWRGHLPTDKALLRPNNDAQFLSLEAISGLPMGSAQKKLLLALMETEQ